MKTFFQHNLFHITLLLLALYSPVLVSDISNTKHNLSVTGTGTIKASGEQEICVFCHTPHHAAPMSPLWNRASSGSVYTPYNSSTIVSSPGQPTGASMLCLSCHDGTIALGSVLSRSSDIVMDGGVTTMPAGASRIGTDLSDDHPISFDYTSGLAAQRGELVDPGTLTGPVKVDNNSQMQCTSCHDPHDDTNGKFLVMANAASALCQTCHVKDFWNETAHSSSSATWNGTSPDPWPNTDATTVAGNACENCHTPHNAGSQQRILNYAVEENNCTSCHNGNVANHNIEAEFNKSAIHPVSDTTDIHDPAESAVVNSRHVECVDCHNPHAANGSNPLNGVRGINQGGSEITTINRTEELCYRCHGDSNNKPPPNTTRQLGQTNVRLEFDTANPSYHPIAGTGKNPNVPSLIPPLSTSSTISCLDCHNNNNGPGTNGSGPNGPHGSIYEPILERQYLTLDPTTESASAYAMCYKCHDRNSILGDNSFSRHSRHITGGGMGGGGMGGGGMALSTPCNVCHDPHGISATQGNSVNNSKLINFDTSVVSPSSSGILRFESTGTFSGRCYLSCHGNNHNPRSYGGGGGGGGGGGM
jgi:predicted CXXCH cytochrome family protein